MEAPPCPEGMSVGPPDFVGVGAQKAGTSWWYDLLAQHPDVYVPPALHKERHFFDRYWSEPFDDGSVDAYHGWFPRPPGTITGEWTPDYLYFPWTLPLLRRAAPDAKVLCLLRDPVDRYRSGLAHDRRRGLRQDAGRAMEAFTRGLYAPQLRRLHELFDPGSVLVMQYERCVLEPEVVYRTSCRFLGIDDSFLPPHLDRRVNPTPDTLGPIPPPPDALVEAFEEDVRELVALGLVDAELWPNFSGTA